MNIILATGIYPPDIGGPATYVRHLAEELSKRGEDVTVLTYGMENGKLSPRRQSFAGQGMENGWKVIQISKAGGPLLRWRRYAQALKEYGSAADIVECFSSVSCGIPLKMAKLTKPKKILRLGGDFTWERYTDLGRRRTLKDFTLTHRSLKFPMARLLKIFDHIVFSTQFQERLYEQAYRGMPKHSVIENALPLPLPPEGEGGRGDGGVARIHQKHDPFRLLYLGRFVKFKNLDRLLRAAAGIPHVTLTLVGEGPEGNTLSALARTLQMQGRVSIVPPVHGEDVRRVFDEHDLFVIPSLTEISPNAALEARAAGLPVLLTEENGLSADLSSGMILRPLLTTNDITKAILEADHRYDEFAQSASAPFSQERGWGRVANEHLALFHSMLLNSLSR